MIAQSMPERTVAGAYQGVWKNMENEMKVGVIGAGQIARIHGPIILNQRNVEIVGIADKDFQRAKTLGNDLKVKALYQDAGVMIQEQRPDVVHLLVPPQYHAHVALIAMDQGCHILVEKPMALTLEDAQRMVDAARRNRVLLCVNHNMIYEDVVQQAIRLFREGAIGELASVEACHVHNARRDQAILEEGAPTFYWSYRLNGGPLQDLMPHMASLVFEFLPEMEEVQAMGLNRGVLPEGWPDEIRVLVKSQKLIAYISISLSERPDTITLTLKGTRGTLHANIFNQVLVLHKQSGLPRPVIRGLSGFHAAYQNLKGSIRNVFKFALGKVDKSSGIGQVIQEFYQAIREQGESPISVEKSLRVLELIHRIWPAPVVDVKKLKAPVQASTVEGSRPAALVTGASGFIGVHLIKKLLSENVSVRALVRPNSVHAGRLKKFDIEVFEGNLADPQAVNEATQGIEVIYHAGAATNNNWYDHEQSTILGTENLIHSALDHRVKRFVHLSTLAVYELNSLSDNTIIKEEAPYQTNPKKMGAYAYSKIEAEKLVLEAYRKRGLGVTIVRPGIVIGPTGIMFFPHLGFRNQDNLFLVVKRGRNRLPLTYVENTVEAIYQASLEEKAIGEIYNLIDEGQLTVRDYLESFKEIAGVKARIISVPFFAFYWLVGMIELASFWGLLKIDTSRAQFKWKHKNVIFDSTKARVELGWQQKVPLEEGLLKTFQWYLEHCRN